MSNMPALAGIKRLREDYDDDLAQFQVGLSLWLVVVGENLALTC